MYCATELQHEFNSVEENPLPLNVIVGGGYDKLHSVGTFTVAEDWADGGGYDKLHSVGGQALTELNALRDEH